MTRRGLKVPLHLGELFSIFGRKGLKASDKLEKNNSQCPVIHVLGDKLVALNAFGGHIEQSAHDSLFWTLLFNENLVLAFKIQDPSSYRDGGGPQLRRQRHD
jgi:hypothetical protein